MTRISAFLTHLAISLIIFVILLYFIVFIWYPQPFFATDGGWQGIQIVAFVDIVLGPLLTLVVFDTRKPELKTDLTIIAVIQILALGWGVWTTYHERPVAVVFTEDHLNPVTSYQMQELGLTDSDIQKYGQAFPRYIYSDIPAGLNQRTEFLSRAFREGKPLYLYPELYRPASEREKNIILASSIDVLRLADNQQDKAIIQHTLARINMDYQLLSFIPLLSRHEKVIAVFERRTFTCLDYIKIDPETYLEKAQQDNLEKSIQQEKMQRKIFTGDN